MIGYGLTARLDSTSVKGKELFNPNATILTDKLYDEMFKIFTCLIPTQTQ